MGSPGTYRIWLGLGYILFGAASIAAAQTAITAVPVEVRPVHRIVRELRDPATGAHWLLVKGENRGGPARLVQAPAVDCDREPFALNRRTRSVPVIHPGDRVRVEEHTAAADAYLEAIAIDGAPPGSRFKARLTIGGKVVRAVALAPGRAALLPAFIPLAEAKP